MNGCSHIRAAFLLERLYFMEKHKRVELLAPAGSPAAFYGAVAAGADAVYLGGDRFGARAYAENFTQEELVACIRYGRLFGVKVNLTVNTLLGEEEIAELPAYLTPYYQAGLDAVIVQDLGVLKVIRENFPGLNIHASTQMTLCSAQGARLLGEMGASRIVPARELGLSELSEIKRTVDIELETFIHGAMCYCYSGQCLFSSILGGRSGNRGRCAQPCRLPYQVRYERIPGDKGEMIGGRHDSIYPLSLKDMCTIEHIPAFIEAGIDSFKIEGRMKRPEYAAGVTAVYRKYIDRYYELRERLGEKEARNAYQVEPQDARLLSMLYIRSQVQDGYYFRQNGREMITLDNPAYSGTDDALLEEISKAYLEDKKRLEVAAEAEFLTGHPAKVTLRRGDSVGEAMGEMVQAAENRPITEENLRRQLCRLGETPFRIGEMRLQIDGDAFYPLKQINELRRQAAWELEQALSGTSIDRPRQSTNQHLTGADKSKWSAAAADDSHCFTGERTSQKGWTVSVQTFEQLERLISFREKSPDISLRRVYVDGDLLVERKKDILQLSADLRQQDSCKFMAAMPYVLRQNEGEYSERLAALSKDSFLGGFLVRSLDELGLLRGVKDCGTVRGDAGLYVWNSQAAGQLAEELDGFCIPWELRSSAQRKLLQLPFSWEKIVYGRIPMMVTANCVLKTVAGCKKGAGGQVWLVDRYKKSFPVWRNCAHCVNVIYNSVPFSLHREYDVWRDVCDLRLDFTLESGAEMEEILNVFWKKGVFRGEYTTGHEKRGVE